MSEGRVFSGGLPVRPDVELLREAFEVEPGKLIKHTEIEEVLGMGHKSNRYRTVVASWRRMVERESFVRIDAETNVGYRMLNPHQALSRSETDIDHVARQTRKATIRVEMIDTAEMSEQAKARHSLVRRQAHLLNDVARQARKEIAEPARTTGLMPPKLVKS